MIKLCIIDDVHDISNKLIEKLKKEPSLNCVDWDNSKIFSFPLMDEKTGEICTYDEQIQKIYNCILSKWNLFDLFLLDWSLYGNNDVGKNAISIAVINKLLKNSNFQSEIKEEKKFLLLVTGKNAKGINYSFENLDNKIICVDKPSREERLINKSSCRCPYGIFKKPCSLYNKSNKRCNINQCLPQIINTINLIMEDKDV